MRWIFCYVGVVDSSCCCAGVLCAIVPTCLFVGVKRTVTPQEVPCRVVDDKGRRPPAQDSLPSIYVVVVVVHVANGSSALLPFRRAPGGLAVRRFGIASAPAGVPGTHSWRSLGM